MKKLSQKEFLEEEFDRKNWVVSKHELLNMKDSTKELILQSNVAIQDQVDIREDFIYVNPFVIFNYESNPHKIEKRKYPLDMGSKLVRTMTTTIQIPEGYKIDELPKNIAMALPNKDAVFSSNSSVIGNTVYITSTFRTNKIIFNTTEYPALREFYDRMIAKKSELIVLKKVP